MGGFRVVSQAGHSPGLLAFWRESDRTLIVGDGPINLSKDPDHPRWLRLPDMLDYDPAAAIESFRRVQPDHSEYLESRLQLALLLAEEGGPDGPAEAVAALEETLEGPIPSEAQRLRIYRVLAYVHERDDDLSGAIAALERALPLSPDDASLLFDIGVLYDKNGDAETSMEHMRRAVELDPENARALNYLAYTLAERGEDLDEAEALVQRALSIEPNDGYYVDSLGWVYFKTGRFEDAARELERAHALVPEDPIITEHLGDACEKLGDVDRAIRLYRKALDLEPTDENRANLLDKLDRLDRADASDR